MKLEKPKNSNYACNVVKVMDIISIPNRDRVCHAVLLGNKVIVSKDIKIGDIGVYFTVETQLAANYCFHNNLYVDKTFNKNKEVGGYIDISKRRIRCVKFAGNESNGLFMPLNSLSYLKNIKLDELNIGDEFDEIFGEEICRKYEVEVKQKNQQQTKSNKRNNKLNQFNKLEKDQFHFHIDTGHLNKNIYRIEPNDIIQLSCKFHGTSSIFSNIL
jgi:hypothetical protein